MLRNKIGFRYADRSDPLMAIRTIGWESTASDRYDWNGLTREDKFVIFQYSLAGEGQLVYGDRQYTVPKDHGFFVTIPGNHRYYYRSASGSPWEYIFLTAAGAHVFSYWTDMIGKNGPVVHFKPSSQPIVMLWDLMRRANDRTLQDKYEISVRLYEWIVACMRVMDGRPAAGQPLPEAVSAALAFIENHYHRFLTLDEIAQSAGASKYHFCRLFVKHTGMTPVHYLTKIRIEEAARQLRLTNQSVAAIAAATGFDSSSYFGKVFRRLLGASPQQFRDSREDIPDHHLLID